MSGVMHGWDTSTNPPTRRELRCDSTGQLLVSGGGGGGGSGALPPDAATLSEQQLQRPLLAAIQTATQSLAARTYNNASHIELAPGGSLALPAGTYHSVSWSVAPTDRNAPNFNQRATVTLNVAANYYVNESGRYTATALASQAFNLTAVDCRALVTWEF
jgi:hypothetical protein